MTTKEAIYLLRNTAWLAPSLEPIDEAIEMACDALDKIDYAHRQLGIAEQTEPIVRCKDCDNYAGDGMYCAWNVLTGDMGYCHHARPKGSTSITAEPNCSEKPNNCETCKWGERYRQGYDITMMDDECGGCCSWNSKWTPKDEPKDEPQIIACPINERAEYWFYEDEPQTERSE